MKKHTFLIIIFILLFSEFLYAEQPPQERWGIRYDGPGNSDDFSSGIAIDNLGNVYVTGRSDDSGAVPDYATIKYDSNGTQKWAARYNGSGSDYDWAHAIAVDNSGNVYVTGESWGGAAQAMTMRRLDTTQTASRNGLHATTDRGMTSIVPTR